jgi:ubiquinone/menaquinone biosynthesis C-methylase UbiE
LTRRSSTTGVADTGPPSLTDICKRKSSNQTGTFRRRVDAQVYPSVKPSPELFDGQAEAFDRRAGLEPAQCREIAAAVLELGHVGAAELVVEVGAGTGQIGVWLAAARRYLGFDLSHGMLQRFRSRSTESPACGLVRADANRSWPLAAGSARVIFSSRALHLLEHEHVADEVVRVAHPAGATLIIGRVDRPHESLRARLAREMRARLRVAGFEARGDHQHRRLVDACVQRGAVLLEPVTTARWTVTASARQSLDSWRQLPGLGGVEVPDDIRRAVLRELEGWATEVFGGLDQPFASQEAYVLRPLRLLPVS